MKKTVFIILLVFLIVSPIAYSESNDTQRVLEEYRLSGAEASLESIQIPDVVREMLPNYDPKQVADGLLMGEVSTDLNSFFSQIVRFFVKELSAGKDSVTQILLISFISGLFGVLTQNFGDRGIGQVAFMPCYFSIAGIGISLFYGVAGFVRESLDFAVSFMNASLPVYATLLLTSKTASTVTILNPGVTAAVFLLANLINRVIFPAIFFSVVLSIAEHLSKAVSIHRLNQFLKRSIRWVLCLVATIFTAFISVAQVATQALSGVGARTGKYVVGNLVPIVGGFLTETIDTLFACAGVIRGTMGIGGITLLGISFLSVLLRVMARMWLLQLTAALTEPISDSRIVAFVSDLSEALSLLLGALACAVVSFIIYLAMIIRAGSTLPFMG